MTNENVFSIVMTGSGVILAVMSICFFLYLCAITIFNYVIDKQNEEE